MKITVIGGGPGGLYFSILTKKRLPNCEINIYEQNRKDDAFGFGVVFSDETLSEFLSHDKGSYELIRNSFAYWDDLKISRNGETVSIEGNGFCGCSRKTLLQLLQQRCQEEGVNIYYETKIEDLEQFADSDLILAADGINSLIRSKLTKEFGTHITMKSNRFIWCGSEKPLDAFTYFFKDTPYGAFCAHTYQYEQGKSTWIFECSDETFQKAGFEVTNEETSLAKLEELYKEELGGFKLITNRSHWRQFPHIENNKWYYKNIVLLGDAKATAHYSIGSGTKLAMESAIALSDAVIKYPKNIKKAFKQYDATRRNAVEMIQHAALVSLQWFENMGRHMKLDFDTFSFSVMSRSKKITIENQARRDKKYAERIIKNFNLKNGSNDELTSPAFLPYQLANLTLDNRIVMCSMGQYCANEGLINEWHHTHYNSRAIGGVGLIIAEMTAISPSGKITKGCAGLWNEQQAEAWKKTVDFIHHNSKSKIGIQLGHSGRKGAVETFNLSQPLSANGWELVSASPIPFKEGWPVPKQLEREEMVKIKEQFVASAKLAQKIGFDLIEIQAHHGFLLASFLSPLTNTRSDEYGGEIKNRAQYPLEVIRAVREAIGPAYPLSVRISATDWHSQGISSEDVLYFCAELKKLGVNIINVSTGNTVADQKPMRGRMWQTPYSEWIRNEIGIPTITAGIIQDIDQINTCLLNSRADLIGLGRALLTNPYFVMHAKAYEQYLADDMASTGIPKQYFIAGATLYNFEKKRRNELEHMKNALKPETHQTSQLQTKQK